MIDRSFRQRAFARVLLLISAVLITAPAIAFAAQGFNDWIAGMAADQAPLRWLLYSCAAAVGVVAHYLKRLATGELATPWSSASPSWSTVRVSLADYLLRLRADRTVWMLVAQIAAGAGMALTGTLAGMEWGALIVTAVTTGYSLDSLVNRS